MAVCLALSLILSYLESLIPPLFALPGVKPGLCNVVILFLLYRLGFRDALCVSLCRVVIANLLFGSLPAAAFGAAGALLSLCGMALLKRLPCFSPCGVSIAGGVLHNLGQIAVAVAMTKTPGLVSYLPLLLVSGICAGVLVGLLAALLLQKVPASLTAEFTDTQQS